jgi:NitT/TauT family transport system permease protein
MKLNRMVVTGPIAVMAFWFVVTASGLVDGFFLPGPAAVFSEMFRMIATGFIVPDIALTVERVLAAFAIGLGLGLPAGLALGSSRRVYESMEFVIDFFRSIPATAVFPLVVLIFGIGDGSKIAVAVFSVFLVITFNTAHGLMHSKKSRELAAKLMGATKAQIFRHVSFWESLPQTFVGMRIAISFSLIIIIITEMFIGTYAGLGKRIIDFQYVYNVTGMYAAIIIAGLVGYMLNMMLILIEKKALHWSGK